MNKVVFSARLTKDPETRYSNDGKAVTRFDIAVNRKFKRENEPDADFFSCVCFGKTAEVVERYVAKGTKLMITGEVRNNNYTNREGQKVYGTQILVDEIEFCESKNSGESAPSQPYRRDTSGDGFMNIPDGIEDKLPFN